MTVARFVPGVVVLALSALLFGSQAFSFAAAGGEGEYTVIVKKVEVKTTNADKKAWDPMDGKPDLRVRIQNISEKDSKAHDTKEKTDAFVAEFNEPVPVKFRTGQRLEVTVLDVDGVANDEIGKINVNTEKITKEGTIRLEAFGQVILVELEMKKVAK
jgi:hypothetical protein